MLTWYADSDGDSYGDAATTDIDCEQPTGFVADYTDCDDTDAAQFPGADELCNGEDDDCDGRTDEDDATDVLTWYADADGDSYGDAATTDIDCDQPTGFVDDDADCDDSDAAVNPAATEACNGVDDDCDGLTDDEDAHAGGTVYFRDDDGDGYGDAMTPSTAMCEQPSGYVEDDTDCDDADAAVHPAATETCNGVDDDCDGLTDDDDAHDGGTVYFQDDDGDGYGDAMTPSSAMCEQPSGYVEDDTDCDDTDTAVNPSATEACNGSDDDCDGDVDEGVIGTGSACAAISCAEVLLDDSSATDGSYYLEGTASGVFTAYCDMSSDGGGWTLIGSVVNEALVTGSHDRNWNSTAVWTDSSTFGAISDRQAADYKSEAFHDIPGDDFLVRTDEYSFAFYSLIGDMEFATFINDEYDSTTCSTTFLASGADWSDVLDADQEAFQSFVVGPWDNNASCFPNGNENAMIGFQLAECCWAPGLGNTPSGQASWEVYDLSLLQIANINPISCTAGSYPCNDQGWVNPNTENCYGTSCKVTWAEMYVR